MKKHSTLFLLLLNLLLYTACTSKPIKINEEQDSIKIVSELPSELTCKEVGQAEVKDILESSAIEELKTSIREMNGNFLIITETQYKGPFVIHKAKGFFCK